MYLLVNVLEQTEQLPDILRGFSDIGIRGSTVLHSTGMGRILMSIGDDNPKKEEINRILSEAEATNKTILTVVKDQESLDKAIEIVHKFCGELTEPGKGVLFSLKLDRVVGIPET